MNGLFVIAVLPSWI